MIHHALPANDDTSIAFKQLSPPTVDRLAKYLFSPLSLFQYLAEKCNSIFNSDCY